LIISPQLLSASAARPPREKSTSPIKLTTWNPGEGLRLSILGKSHGQEGDAMKSAEKYLRLARECMQFVAVVDNQYRAALLSMAEDWLRLADKAVLDEGSRRAGGSPDIAGKPVGRRRS
jgi:hypothetical protein